MKSWILALSLSVASYSYAADHVGQRVRKLHLKRDEIALVRTAIGIATIIQVPDRPTSLVLGDTNAFKVEYLENAITVKPLGHSSKSNLYIYTDGRRFNVSLISVPPLSADYIVYLEPEVAAPDPTAERWRDYVIAKSGPGFTVTITRLGRNADLLMVKFKITARKTTPFKPEWIWLTQTARTIPIQDLNLSAIEVTENAPVSAFLSVKSSDLRVASPLVLEIRSQSPLKFKLPEVKAWVISSRNAP